MTRRLLQAVWVLLAIIFLIEAWLWDHLEPIVARIVACVPLHEFKRWLAGRVDALSPAMTLIVFVVPAIPLFPLKLIGMWLLMHHHWGSAVLTILFAKFLGIGVMAFVFDVTRHKLLEMPWFEKLYGFILELRRRAWELIDPIKRRESRKFWALPATAGHCACCGSFSVSAGACSRRVEFVCCEKARTAVISANAANAARTRRAR